MKRSILFLLVVISNLLFAQEVIFKTPVEFKRLDDLSAIVHDKYVIATGHTVGGMQTYLVQQPDKPIAKFQQKRTFARFNACTSTETNLTLYVDSQQEGELQIKEYMIFNKEFNKFTASSELKLPQGDRIIAYIPQGEILFILSRGDKRISVTQFKDGRQIERNDAVVTDLKLWKTLEYEWYEYMSDGQEPRLDKLTSEGKVYLRDGIFYFFTPKSKLKDEEASGELATITSIAYNYKNGEFTSTTYPVGYPPRTKINSFLYGNDLYILSITNRAFDLQVLDQASGMLKQQFRYDKGQPNALKMTPLMREGKNIETIWGALTGERLHDKIHNGLDGGIPIVGAWPAEGGKTRVLLGDNVVTVVEASEPGPTAVTVVVPQHALSTVTTFFSYLNDDLSLATTARTNGAYEQIERRLDEKKTLKIVDHTMAPVDGGVCLIYLDKDRNFVVEKFESK